MEERVSDSTQPRRLLAGWKAWQYALFGAALHVGAIWLFELALLATAGNPWGWGSPPSPYSWVLFCRGYTNQPLPVPVHELAFIPLPILRMPFSPPVLLFAGFFVLALQTLAFTYCFVRSARRHQGFAPMVLLAFVILSGLNSAVLWICGWWIGFLRNPEWQMKGVERIPLISTGSLPGQGFMYYLNHGLYLYGRITIPFVLLELVFTSPSVLSPGDRPPDWMDYIAYIATAWSGITAISVLYALPSLIWGILPDYLIFCLFIFTLFMVPVAIAAFYAWRCTEVGYAPRRYNSMFTRFALVNSVLMFIFLFFMRGQTNLY